MHLHIISRKTAKLVGLKYYFTGNKCQRGGIGQRFTSSGGCVCEFCLAVKKESCKKWMAENKEYRDEYRREREARNIEVVREKRREYYQKNKLRMSARYAAYYAENTDGIRERARKWYKNNVERKRQYDADYNNKNKRLISARRQAKYIVSAERQKAASRKYRAENPVSVRISTARWREGNKGKTAHYNRHYRELNRESCMARNKARRAAKANAIPKWYGELDTLVMEEAYSLCLIRTAETGINWHMDHMIPLRADAVCGLHVWNNIQVIPARMNLAKRNRLQLTEPGEWLKA